MEPKGNDMADELVAALKPFADHASIWPSPEDNLTVVAHCHVLPAYEVTLGTEDFRRAANVLARLSRPNTATHRHLKSGHLVREIGRGFAQVSVHPIEEMTGVSIYEHDGKLWVRNAVEFDDGRFEELSSASGHPSPQGGAEPGDGLGEFKPCVSINEEVGITEAIFEDTAYVAVPVFDGVHHYMDKHVAMDDGRLVGFAVWQTAPHPIGETGGTDKLVERAAYIDASDLEFLKAGKILYSDVWHGDAQCRRDTDVGLVPLAALTSLRAERAESDRRVGETAREIEKIRHERDRLIELLDAKPTGTRDQRERQMLKRTETAESSLAAMQAKCCGCLTPAERDETINELSAALAAEKLRVAELTAISEAAVASLEQRVAALVGALAHVHNWIANADFDAHQIHEAVAIDEIVLAAINPVDASFAASSEA